MEAPRFFTLSPSSSSSTAKPSETILLPLSSSSTSSIHNFTTIRCHTKRRPPRSSYWDSNAETSRSNRFKFKFEDEPFENNDYSSDSRYRWRDNQKRKWWSDDGGDGDEEDDVGTGRGGNGVVEDVIESVWFFKVIRSYGWLLPPIIISMLVATGPKAFLMALALPLGQSALSYAIDKLFGRIKEKPKPRRRPKRKPFARANTNVDTNEEELDESSGIGERRQGYQSWVATDNGSVQQKIDRNNPSFGGWDDLDRRQRSDKGTTGARRKTTGGPPKQGAEKGKMSRRGRHREAPLLLRLLISVFPFLGSWTRLL